MDWRNKWLSIVLGLFMMMGFSRIKVTFITAKEKQPQKRRIAMRRRRRRRW